MICADANENCFHGFVSPKKEKAGRLSSRRRFVWVLSIRPERK
jgi:hypothetical protein